MGTQEGLGGRALSLKVLRADLLAKQAYAGLFQKVERGPPGRSLETGSQKSVQMVGWQQEEQGCTDLQVPSPLEKAGSVAGGQSVSNRDGRNVSALPQVTRST